MYLSSSTLILAFLFHTWTALVVATTSPACLIKAIGNQPNPADVKGLCSSYKDHVISNITQECPGAQESPAKSAYAATCSSEASIHIVFNNSTSDAPHPTGTGSSYNSPTNPASSTVKSTTSPSSPAATQSSINSAGGNSPLKVSSIIILTGALLFSQFLL